MTLNTEIARQFAELTQKKRRLDDQLDQVKKQLAELERPLLENMAMEGVDSLPIQCEDGEAITIYFHRQIWAYPKDNDKAAAANALKLSGLGDFVTEGFNTQSVSAWAREQLSNGEAIPDPFKAAFDLTEKVGLRGRRGGRATRSDASKNLAALKADEPNDTKN